MTRTRASIYLDAASNGSESWTVLSSGRPFGVAEVHDLFLSVFGDDPGATARLSPITGVGLFEDPWN